MDNATMSGDRERRLDTLSGNIKPIQTSFNLKAGEHAYFQFETERKADIHYMDSHTTGTTKQKGIIGRAVVGDIIFGKAGAIIGGVTAGSETTLSTRQKRSVRTETIDKGIMLFTNERMLFVAKHTSGIVF